MPGQKPDARRSERWISILVVCAGIVVLAVAWAVLLTPHASLFVYYDNANQTYPWWQFAVREVQAGRLPLWDPFSGGGRSFIGEGQTAGLYPPLLALAAAGGRFASSEMAMELFAYVHSCIGLIGAYLVGRGLGLHRLAALCTGLVFALGGYFSFRSFGQLNIFDSLAWTPWILAGIVIAWQRGNWRWAVMSGFGLALSILAGHFEPAILVGLVVGPLLLAVATTRHPVSGNKLGPLRTAAAGLVLAVTGAGLSAPQLLPSLEYQGESLRFVGMVDPLPSTATIPLSVIEINPRLHANQLEDLVVDVTVEDGSILLGGAALLLCLYALAASTRTDRFLWLAIALIGILLSFGGRTPALPTLHLLPLVDKVREPVRYLFLTHVSMAVLAGFGVNCLFEPTGRRRRTWAALAIVLVAAVTLVAAPLVIRRALRPDTLWVPLACTALVPLLLGVGGFARRAQLPIVTALIALVVAPLVLAFWQEVPRSSPALPDAPAQYLQTASDATPSASTSDFFRVDYDDSGLPPNLGDVNRVAALSFHAATAQTRPFRLRQRLGFYPPSTGAEIFAVRYLYSLTPTPGLQRVGSAGAAGVYGGAGSVPFAWMPPRTVASADNHALDAMASSDFNPLETAVVLPGDRVAVPTLGPTNGRVVLSSYGPDEVRLHETSPAKALLVTSDVYYPGWRAWIDGQPAPLLRVDYAFRGVVVPAGSHQVTFSYRPVSFFAGVALALAVGLGLVLVFRWPR